MSESRRSTTQPGSSPDPVEVFSDSSSVVAALQRADEMREMALLDPLTGTGNRRYTELSINARLEETRRYGWPFGLLFIDIDYFKAVNDANGHETGDEVLKMVAKTLLSSMRPFDFLGRWGGEEFVALIMNVDEQRLRQIAERSRSLIEQSRLSKGSATVSVTVSVGATVARADDTLRVLIERADRLMYSSK
jgi:diguanylate cyclase (GGDEF)-like protein